MFAHFPMLFFFHYKQLKLFISMLEILKFFTIIYLIFCVFSILFCILLVQACPKIIYRTQIPMKPEFRTSKTSKFLVGHVPTTQWHAVHPPSQKPPPPIWSSRSSDPTCHSGTSVLLSSALPKPKTARCTATSHRLTSRTHAFFKFKGQKPDHIDQIKINKKNRIHPSSTSVRELPCFSGFPFAAPQTPRAPRGSRPDDDKRREGPIAIGQPCRRRGGGHSSRSSSSATAGQPIAPSPLLPPPTRLPRPSLGSARTWISRVAVVISREALAVRFGRGCCDLCVSLCPFGLISSGVISAGSGRRR
jgi:hypothetical protein